MTDPVTMPKTYLVVLALYRLGGEGDVETIAVKAHELFPQEFSWRNYPELPDKDAVRVHLSEAKKATFGGLVIDKDLRKERRGDGGYTKRFALTPRGLEKAKELERMLETAPMAATKNPIEYKRLVEPVLQSPAFRQFSAGRAMLDIGRDAFLLAFKLFGDASDFVIVGRLARAEAVVARMPESSEKTLLMRFIKEGRDAHGV